MTKKTEKDKETMKIDLRNLVYKKVIVVNFDQVGLLSVNQLF